MDELPSVIEAGVTLPMRDYQATALQALLGGVVYLALEQGLGKTRILIEYARAIGASWIAVFCPASVRMVWVNEFVKWWPESPEVVVCNWESFQQSIETRFYPVDTTAVQPLKSKVWVFSYDCMSRDFSPSFLDEIGITPIFDLAICDEAHFLKTPGAARTRAVFEGVRPHATRMIAASGTPAPNHAGELYPPLRALAPETLRSKDGRIASQTQFENAFCKVEDKWFSGRHVRKIVGSKNTDMLRERLEGVMLRMKKKDVLPELPPLDFVVVPIVPSMRGVTAEQLGSYADIISPEMNDDEALRALQSRDESVARMRAVLGMLKATAAAEYLSDFLSGSDKKIVVWAEHHAVIDLLAERLAAHMPVVIDGRTAGAARKAAVDHFLNEPKARIFIGNIVAAGTGLTLIGPNCDCSDAFFVESSYTPGNNLQAAARIHRLGQKDGVLARVFTAAGTIDDRIQSIITRKSKDLAAIFDKGD